LFFLCSSPFFLSSTGVRDAQPLHSSPRSNLWLKQRRIIQSSTLGPESP
jgi:hypothetical protein